MEAGVVEHLCSDAGLTPPLQLTPATNMSAAASTQAAAAAADDTAGAAAAGAAAAQGGLQQDAPVGTGMGPATMQMSSTVSDCFASLLGQASFIPNFLTACWEARPVLYRASTKGTSPEVAAVVAGRMPVVTAQQQQQQQQHTGIEGTPARASVGCSAAQALAVLLTPCSVLNDLLPGAVHCPVLPAALDDPVQVCEHGQSIANEDLTVHGTVSRSVEYCRWLVLLRDSPSDSSSDFRPGCCVKGDAGALSLHVGALP
jgi:hypothetical protein